MPKNNFQDWQENIESNYQLPDDLEYKIMHQRDTLSQFVKVIEVFVPNAMQIAVDMVSGQQHLPKVNTPHSSAPHSQPNWRMPIPPPSGPQQPTDILSRFSQYENIRKNE